MPPQMLASKTVSMCTPQTTQGTHVFDIFGYIQHRNMAVSNYIRSGSFSIGGHDWYIVLFPDGIKKNPNCIVIALFHHAKGAAKVRASYDLRLVNQTSRLGSSVRKQTMEFDTVHLFATLLCRNRSEFEKLTYIQDDRLTIECNVTVFKEPHVSETKSFPEIEALPSDLTEHLCKLFHEKEGMGVTFSVGGQTFGAHKVVLAMRSPVFKAEFYGPMTEARAELVTTDQAERKKCIAPLSLHINVSSYEINVRTLTGFTRTNLLWDRNVQQRI
ncbi:BTB/POZ and MATH domain-containing protein 1-like [Lolium perenne]|uniref:BTB/POZ and MATH domain-containing protein 1-like n=1 Tax=Lolium perenne TaxID=4522 RepID=UPI003A9A23F7